VWSDGSNGGARIKQALVPDARAAAQVV